MVLRRASVGDLETLIGMSRRYCDLDRHLFDEGRTRAALTPLLESDRHGVVWMLGPGPEPEGYAVVTWGWSVEGGGAEALLDEIFLDTRGAGLGAAAVTEILADCRARGMARVFLETESHNVAARRLYGRLGFSVEDSVWMSREL